MKIKSVFSAFIEFFELTFIMSAVIVLSYIFVGQLLEVSGDSMYPTYHDKEQMVAEKLSIKYKEPHRGEIMIFSHPTQKEVLIIKRVIGMPGETFTLKDGNIYINGNLLQEPYLKSDIKTEGNVYIKEGIDFRVPDNSYVMLGDNRDKSTDSRYWGPISKDRMVGRSLFVYYPLSNFRITWK